MTDEKQDALRVQALMEMKGLDKVQAEWMNEVLKKMPLGSRILQSERGHQVVELCLNYDLNDFNWHRSDYDTFWIDCQMFVKYKLSDEEILFILKQQPGVDNYQKHALERNAYAEMMRGIKKLRLIQSGKHNEIELKYLFKQL